MALDPRRFDTLARSLHELRSRRGALVALMSGTLGLLGLAETTAKKKKGKGKGKKKGGKKGGNPSPPSSPPPHACTPDCSAGRNCGDNGCGGSCGSCSGTLSCGGGGTAGVCGTGCLSNCQNANGTPRNCGDDGCGNSCGPCTGENYACEPSVGFCGCRIHNDITPCEGGCVNWRTSQDHCGRCNNPCIPGQICCNGRCTNPLRDNANCGACGTVCVNPDLDLAPFACCAGACIEDYRCPGE
jgi:hypothetical protein